MTMNPSELHWKTEYEIGVEEVDLQHHYFFDLIKRLSGDLLTSEDMVYKDRLLNELLYYGKFHFLSEENIMMKYGYPDIKVHKMLHLSLIDELSHQHSSDANVQLDFLIDWFTTHTMGADREFGQFVKEQSYKTGR